MKNREGYRGYIGTRMEMERSTPQHIQQMVMRDYCKSRNMQYLLAAVEYRMPGCTMILDAVMQELPHLEGAVMYSLYLFPQDKQKRMQMYRQFIEQGCALHTAAEGHVIRSWEDAMKMEDIWLVHNAMQGQERDIFSYLEQWDKKAYAAA